MKILRMYESSVNDRYLDEIADTLRDGGLIVYPTDSIYAIGCNALNNRAIERICRIKQINPEKESLSVVCENLSMASEYARVDNKAFQILRANLPGPFTFILPAATTLPKVFKGRKTVGIRIPDNNIARSIAGRLGNPVLSTTVELSEDELEAMTVDPQELAERYQGAVDIVIDAGEGGVQPSTVVDLTDSSSPEIVREGIGEL